MEFKDRLRAEIENAGDTQTEACRKIGCSQGSLTYWLVGGHPRYPMLQRIYAAYPALRSTEPIAS